MPVILTVISDYGKEYINVGIRITVRWGVTPCNWLLEESAAFIFRVGM
jgi:hypothetical protein